MQNHHCVPLNIGWNNKRENIIRIADNIHSDIHYTQDIPHEVIRVYRKKVNHILIPNDYTLDLKKDLRLRYFEKPFFWVQEQKQSLLNQQQSGMNIKDSFEKIVIAIIEEQKNYIRNILKYGWNNN
jgi:hypothetical protein